MHMMIIGQIIHKVVEYQSEFVRHVASHVAEVR